MSHLKDIVIHKNYSEGNKITIEHCSKEQRITVNNVFMEYEDFLDYVSLVNSFAPFIGTEQRKLIQEQEEQEEQEKNRSV